MRTFSSLLILAALVLGAFAVAGAHEDPAEKTELQDQIKDLELQVQYLLAREEALTRYVLINEKRAAGLEEIARSARVAGFENRKIPVDSRKILLRGLEGLAASLRKDLPALSREQQVMLKKIKAGR